MSQQNMMELEKLEGFVRELVTKQSAPMDRNDIRVMFENIYNRPVMEGQTFPDVEILQMLATRIMSDESRLRELENSPMKPIVALLPYISQQTTAYIEWKAQKQSEESADSSAA